MFFIVLRRQTLRALFVVVCVLIGFQAGATLGALQRELIEICGTSRTNMDSPILIPPHRLD